MTANAGYTETPDDEPGQDGPERQPHRALPRDDHQLKSYATYVGAVNVTASSYGNPVSYTPEDRAYSAIDGNLDTAWNTGTFVPDPAGQWWQAQFPDPVTTDQITLVQPQRGDRTRWISKVTLTFDGKDPSPFDLGRVPPARGPTVHLPGARLPYAARHHRRHHRRQRACHSRPLRSASPRWRSPDSSARGRSDAHRSLRPRRRSASDRLTYVMSRQRTSPYPTRSDPETTITRQFTLPTARTFTISGSASLSSLLPDDEIDRLVGRTPTPADGYARLLLGPHARQPERHRVGHARRQPGSAWQPGFGLSAEIGATLTYNLTKPQTLDHFTLKVLADGRHSVPTAMTISSGSQVRTVTLPPIADSTVPGATTTVPVSFPPLTGSHFVVTFTAVRPEYANNYYSAGPLALPLGIAKIGFPGVKARRRRRRSPGTCVSNLLSIDGRPIDVAIVGSTQNALDNGEVQMVPCGPDAKGITLEAGPHVVRPRSPTTRRARTRRPRARAGTSTSSSLDSAAGGGPGPSVSPTAAGAPSVPPAQAGTAPTVVQPTSHIDSQSDLVSGADPALRVRAGSERRQGLEGSGHARARCRAGLDVGRPRDLPTDRRVRQRMAGHGGRPPALGGSGFTIQLTWTPQKEIWAALAVSGATLALCLLLGFLPSRVPALGASEAAAPPARPGRSRGRRAGHRALRRPHLDLALLAPPKEERQRGWLRVPRALIIGAVTAGVAALVVSGPAALVVGALVALGLVVPWARVVAPWEESPSSSPAAPTWSQGQNVHNYLPGANWAGTFVQAGNLIWLGVVLLLADAVITGFGLRLNKPLGRRKLRAGDPGPIVDTRPVPPIVGIDG